MAPLYPRQHLQPQDNPYRVRDLQVWPRSMRETHERQELRRTAAVKHHLRTMADRGEMLTTYEHDFGLMTRPNPKGRTSGFGSSFYGTGGLPPSRSRSCSISPSRSRIAAPRPRESGSPGSEEDDTRSNRSNRSNRSSRTIYSSRSMGELGATARDPTGSLGYSTFSKLDTMSAAGVPMRLSVNGWGDQAWSQKSHPHMIVGMSQKRCGLEQVTKIMNLRAPDVPFSTR